jgi:hypothetical protein
MAFSHRQHAGDLQIACLYCHYGADRSRYAGISASSVCMNCHFDVTNKLSELAQGRKGVKQGSELEKLYESLALDKELKRRLNKAPRPVEWVQVYKLPAFVYFDHRPHVQAGITCLECHGPVETMVRIRQVSSLTMGWCVHCHRQSNRQATVDCATCHR